MNFFKETGTAKGTAEVGAPKLEGLDTSKVEQPDAHHWIPDAGIEDKSVSDLADIFNSAFKSFGFNSETSETKSSESNESFEKNDFSRYLEKGDGGNYYDKETGKAYESLEAWVKSQDILAKRYEGVARYYEHQAKKEYASYKNAEQNGESDAEKWEHYRSSQEYYAKTSDCKEKAVHIREKIDSFSTVTEFTNDLNSGELSELHKAYMDDLKRKSDCPKTLENAGFDISEMRKLSPEETAQMREEFDDCKAELKKQWEELNGRPWPKYEEDVYSASGKLIRKTGSDYDAHHIHPLCLGGKNEAKNITPLHAEVHYDKQGVHAPDSPYSKMEKLLGGVDK